MNEVNEAKYTKHQEKAIELFKNGYNCAQSILVAFKDKTNLDTDTSLKVAASFGGGIAGTGKICGTINAAVMIIGLIHGNTDMLDTERKVKTKEITRNLINDFSKIHKGLNCTDLLLEDNDKKYPMHSEKCISIVKEVCDLLEKYLED